LKSSTRPRNMILSDRLYSIKTSRRICL